MSKTLYLRSVLFRLYSVPFISKIRMNNKSVSPVSYLTALNFMSGGVQRKFSASSNRRVGFPDQE